MVCWIEFKFVCVCTAVELLEHEMICWAELHVSAEKGVKSFEKVNFTMKG